MDLSKAFDCLPHDVLLKKLRNYGLSEAALRTMESYLSSRPQRVRIGEQHSSWQIMKKGVPQGSLLGPLLFNIFINDLLDHIPPCATVYNYADDNTLSSSNAELPQLIEDLQRSAVAASDWFANNNMQANPNKFQAIILNPNHKNANESHTLTFQDSVITTSHSVEILGVSIDDRLKFDLHINNLCKKAARQINALRRISHFLDVDTRILIFKSFILSNFNYCPLVWYHCGCQNIKKKWKIFSIEPSNLSTNQKLRTTASLNVSIFLTCLFRECALLPVKFTRLQITSHHVLISIL